MKRLATSIVFWSLIALLPVPATAQITNYAGALGNQEYLDFVGGSGVVSTWTTPTGSRVYVGPYTGRFATGGVTSPQFSLICVDFEHYAGDQWVNVTNLGSGQSDGGLGATRLGSAAGSLSTYRQAAYLGSLFESWQSFGSDRRTVWSGIHAAIWTLMSGSNVPGGTYAARDNFLQLASLNGSSFEADGWHVLSPGQGYNGQEMLIRTNTVPEPSTYLLMGTGLILLFVFGRRRMKQLGTS